jgi:hypothetical protein
LAAVISEMDLEPSAQRSVLAPIALAGIVAGGAVGSRLANNDPPRPLNALTGSGSLRHDEA